MMLRLATQESSVNSFIAFAESLHSRVKDSASDHVKGLEAKLVNACSAINEKLAANDVGEEAFFQHFSTKILSALKKDRAAAKVIRYQWSQFPTEDLDDEVKDCGATLEEAKHQTIKWGLMTFTQNKEIDAETPEGVALRGQLKACWL